MWKRLLLVLSCSLFLVAPVSSQVLYGPAIGNSQIGGIVMGPTAYPAQADTLIITATIANSGNQYTVLLQTAPKTTGPWSTCQTVSPLGGSNTATVTLSCKPQGGLFYRVNVTGGPPFVLNLVDSSMNQFTLASPRGVTYLGGSVATAYISDSANNRILAYNVSTSITSVLTLSGVTLDSPGQLCQNSNRFLYITDTGNNRVIQYDTSTSTTTVLAIGSPGGQALSAPNGCSGEPGLSVYIVDTGNSRIVNWNGTSSSVTSIGLAMSGPDGLGEGNGFLYVADTGHNQIIKWQLGGGTTTIVNPAPFTLNAPQGVSFYQVGTEQALVDDTGSSRALQILDPSGPATPLPGLNIPGGITLSTPEEIYILSTVGFSPAYIADTGNNRVVSLAYPDTGGTLSVAVVGVNSLVSKTGGSSGSVTASTPLTTGVLPVATGPAAIADSTESDTSLAGIGTFNTTQQQVCFSLSNCFGFSSDFGAWVMGTGGDDTSGSLILSILDTTELSAQDGQIANLQVVPPGVTGGDGTIAGQAEVQQVVTPSVRTQRNTTTTLNATSTYTTYHAEGDSITAGFNTTASSFAYPNVIAATESLTLTNNAVAGSTGCDVTNRVFNNENVASPTTTLQTVMVGINDAVNNGRLGDYEEVFKNCQLATLSWLAMPSSAKLAGSAISLPTNWSADTTFSKISGIQSTTNGATAVFPYTTSAQGQEVVVWYRIINGNGGTFSVTDTGGAVATQISNFTYPLLNMLSGTSSVGAYIIQDANRVAGSYTATFTVTSATGAGNIVSILGVGVTPPMNAALPLDYPQVWVGGVTRLLDDSYQTSTTAYDNDVKEVASQLVQDGLGVWYVPVNNFMFATVAEMGNGTPSSNCGSQPSYFIHPCDNGHAEIAHAFMDLFATQASYTPIRNYIPLADPNKQVVSSSNAFQANVSPKLVSTAYQVTCNDQIIYANASLTFTMPSYCKPGKTFLFANATSGTLDGFSAAAGNVSTFTLYPQEFLWVEGYSGNGQYVTRWDGGSTAHPQANLIGSVGLGTGVTSVTCLTAHCGVNGGTYQVVGGSFATGVFATLNWSNINGNPWCAISPQGSAYTFNLTHSVPTASSMTISSGVTIAGQTFTFDYICTAQNSAF